MKSIFQILSILIFVILLNSCENRNPNLNDSGRDELKSLELDHKFDKNLMSYNDTIYIPIYSNIYVDKQNQKRLLAATLSIRNTSYADSLFITKIDYFNTEGTLVKNFIKNPISLPPMATINYVIEKEDDTGGAGANFIVMLSGKNEYAKPIIQAIMIGENGENKGFAFSTDGYSIKSSKPTNHKEEPLIEKSKD
ncbi:DUF3124 domain-containing protein [Psychroserpens sp. Hel_I_66]|uniref:DUF3124 domain-containing protein n=1 Tax=Psychroserpens sp. Hel_I_66 TaxID=1250004 RepID=UPI00068B96DA|nr:DUF3124 domain-containing protein [Psychroserpens sp. Hel_I_66]